MADFYADPLFYDALMGHREEDLAFYRDCALAAKGPVLDLCCGTGRVTIPLARAGVEVTGVDLSEEMLTRAREKCGGDPLPVTWVRADALQFDLGKKFPLVLIPFSSLEHFHDRPTLDALMARVRAHLEPGGRFILDVAFPNPARLARAEDRFYAPDYFGGDPAATGVVAESSSFDPVSRVFTIRLFHAVTEAMQTRVDILNLRIFPPVELAAILEENGFRIVERFGNFDRSALTKASPRQIYVCELKA